MFSSLSQRSRFAVPGALLLSIVLSGQALAATWSTPIVLATSVDVYSGDIATAGGNAVAVYGVSTTVSGDVSEVWARRSIDSGSSWQSPTLLASNGILPAVAGRGTNFDVVWNNDDSGRVRYARSTNSGASFGPSVGLSPLGRYAWRPAVARGPNGVVAVAWEDVGSGAVQVRVSTNGGVSFGPIRTLSMSGDEMGVAVAVGDGVIYAAYGISFERLRLKRSLDNGATWSTAATVTDHAADDGISLTAAGSRAYVAFTAANVGGEFSKVRYRSTSNKGAMWSPAFDLAPASWTTYDPDIALQGGVVRAVFNVCDVDFDVCVDERVYYRQRVLGSSWTSPERVSPMTLGEARVAHVGYAGKILVFYLGDFLPYVRAGTP